MQVTRILTIDPGASGGLVFIQLKGSSIKKIELQKIPANIYDFKKLVRELKPTIAYIEQVGGYIAGGNCPGSHMFNFGEGFGFIKGILWSHEIDTYAITPQKWQSSIMPRRRDTKTESKPQWKRELKKQAQKIADKYGLEVTMNDCDAFLLAAYAMKDMGLEL